MKTIQKIVRDDNFYKAAKAIKSKGTCGGVDGVKPDEPEKYLSEYNDKIRDDILAGCYRPDKVLRIFVDKGHGKQRPLGVPTVRDRLVQKAMQRVIEPIFEEKFLDCSYGFRPGCSTHQAVAKARDFINDGLDVTVAVDLSNCFGTLNHDKLAYHVQEEIDDQLVLKLIRSFSRARIKKDSVTTVRDVGVEQGGPISPLLCNIYLHELDVEMERRDYSYVRFADDFRIFKASTAAGESAMSSVARFVEKKLKLSVNEEKSSVVQAEADEFLGYAFRKRRNEYQLTISETNHRKFCRRMDNRVEDAESESMQPLHDLVWQSIGWLGQYKQCRDHDGRKKALLRSIGAAEQIRQRFAQQYSMTLDPMDLYLLDGVVTHGKAMKLIHSFAPDWVKSPWKY